MRRAAQVRPRRGVKKAAFLHSGTRDTAAGQWKCAPLPMRCVKHCWVGKNSATSMIKRGIWRLKPRFAGGSSPTRCAVIARSLPGHCAFRRCFTQTSEPRCASRYVGRVCSTASEQTIRAEGPRAYAREPLVLKSAGIEPAPMTKGRRPLRKTHQCRKCRIPVKTIARPASSAAAITSSSRIDPPG